MPVWTRAYVDQPIRNIEAAERVAQVAASEWDLERPVLLRNGMNAIFIAGPAVIRVSTPNADPMSALRLATLLNSTGLRVARPARDAVIDVDGMSATCWDRVEPTGQPIDWHEVGSMVRQVHRLDPIDLPHDYPLPSPVAFPWWDFEELMRAVDSELDDAARSGIRGVLGRHEHWTDFKGVVVCHGDIHPGNVIMSLDGPVLIDWDLLCLAPPGWDHGPMMTWEERWGGPPGEYEAFAEGYGRSLRGHLDAESFAELRLLAATLMRVKAGMENDAAKPEAQRRLTYWRGAGDAPTWRAQ